MDVAVKRVSEAVNFGSVKIGTLFTRCDVAYVKFTGDIAIRLDDEEVVNFEDTSLVFKVSKISVEY